MGKTFPLVCGSGIHLDQQTYGYIKIRGTFVSKSYPKDCENRQLYN